jgi:hypothetical protein
VFFDPTLYAQRPAQGGTGGAAVAVAIADELAVNTDAEGKGAQE